MTFRKVFLLAVMSVALCASPARAQSGSRWEFEAHGGFAGGSSAEGGDASAPPSGLPFTIFAGRTSSQVSSWLYGDGARLFNDASATRPFSAATLTPLDPAFDKAATAAGNGASFGFRVGYAVTPRISAEFNLDSTPASEWNDDFLDAVETTRASFVTGWTRLLGTGGGIILFPNASATAATEITRNSGRHLLTTGALTYSFGAQGALTPFITAGAGVRTAGGDGPTATITGNYQFSLSPLDIRLQINETDTVTVRSVSGSAFTMLLGGGLKIAGGSRWGVRTDVRVHFIKNTTDLVLDAAPAVQTSTPGGAIILGTDPSIVFVSNSTTGLVSSLSGPAVNDFTVFEGSGYAVQFNAAAGVYFRF